MAEPLNPVAVCVKPDGNDYNDGRSWSTAFQTIEKALSYLEWAGGGELHVFSPNGEILGQIWLRGDGVSVPGWHGDFPLKVFGYGNRNSSFATPQAFVGYGSATDMETPAIWLAGTFKPKEFHDVFGFAYSHHFIRAWDYQRDVSGNIVRSNITNWVRATGQSTLTINLANTWNITTLSRSASSNVVTMTTACPSRYLSQLKTGMVVRIVSSDPDFDSGDFVITNRISAAVPQTFQYSQVTSTGGPFTSSNPGTVSYAAVGVNDRIEVVSNQIQNVPSTSFKVTALYDGSTSSLSPVAADKIIVNDPYGGNPAGSADGSVSLGTFPVSGAFANPGTWVLQDRYSYNSSLYDFYNVSCFGRGSPPYDASMSGPNIDLGSSNDGRVRMFFSAPAGYTPTHGCPDPDRVCWGLADPGTQNGIAFTGEHLRPSGTGFRMWGSTANTWGLRMIDVLGDVSFGASAPPQVEVVNGTVVGKVYLDGVVSADSDGTNPDVRVDLCAPGSLAINCGPTQGPLILIDSNLPAHKSAWSAGANGWWASDSNDVSLAARLPHVVRGVPLAMSRLPNLVPMETSWDAGGGVITPKGIMDPFGGTRAGHVQGGSGVALITPLGLSVAQGDTFVVGGWFRSTPTGASVLNFSIIDNLGKELAGLYLVQFQGDDEWQFVSKSVIVPNLGVGTSWYIQLDFSPSAVGGTGTDYYLPFLEHLTVATYSANDMAEYVGTISNRVRYLQPGTVGTPEGMPLVGHGGLGIDASIPRVAGSASGQLTIGSIVSYEPRFAADGMTVIGWAPLYSATINP